MLRLLLDHVAAELGKTLPISRNPRRAPPAGRHLRRTHGTLAVRPPLAISLFPLPEVRECDYAHGSFTKMPDPWRLTRPAIPKDSSAAIRSPTVRSMRTEVVIECDEAATTSGPKHVNKRARRVVVRTTKVKISCGSRSFPAATVASRPERVRSDTGRICRTTS